MELFELDDLLPFLGIDPSDEHLEILYEKFKEDFLDNPYVLEGKEVRIDLRASKEEGFEDYPHTFVKLITRGKKSKRCFDKKRANKLHWIKIILDNRNSESVICYRFKEADGSINTYFWYEDGNYIVILKNITANYIIISGFHIDDDRNKQYYRDKYDKRE